MKQLLPILLLMFSVGVGAEDWDDVRAAYKSGDYARSIQIAESMAEKDDLEAIKQLSRLYKRGDSKMGIAADATRSQEYAERWLAIVKPRAQSGDLEMQYALYSAYHTGRLLTEDKGRAINWLRKSAEGGYAQAQVAYGGHLKSSAFDAVSKKEGATVKWKESSHAEIRKADSEAFKWYHRAAEQGHQSGIASVVRGYTTGFGVEENHTKMIEWMRKGIEIGMSYRSELARIFYQGDFRGFGLAPTETDYSKALKWAKEDAVCCEKCEKDKPCGNSCIKRPRYCGDTYFVLGQMYYHGHGVHRDYAQAFKWYSKRAALRRFEESGGFQIGFSDRLLAQYRLGDMHLKGLGTPRDSRAARKLFKLVNEASAEKLLENGQAIEWQTHGYTKDYSAAMKWYQMALMQGSGKAAWGIAYLYGNGRGVPENTIAMYAYMSIGKTLGDSDAADWFEKYERTHDEYQRANGQKMAAEIWARIEAAKQARASGESEDASKKSGGTGTGFIINKQGYAVTNSHVVTDCNQINTVQNGTKIDTTIVTNDTRNDLAVLKMSKRSNVFAKFRSDRGLRAGEDILAFGFPFKSVLSDDLKGTKGMVNALSGPNNDTRFMQISAPVQPGNSGGPLLDHSGNVVGVVTARIDAAKMLKERGKIPQNVNFAIKASLVRDMLEVKDIDYETASSKRELKTVDIFDKAKEFTVLVECLR